MDEQDVLDSIDARSERKSLWTVRLFIASCFLLVLLLIVLSADGALGIPHRVVTSAIPILFIGGMLSSLIGLIFGFIERKPNRKRSLIGIIGNSILLVGCLIFAGVVIFIISQIRMIE